MSAATRALAIGSLVALVLVLLVIGVAASRGDPAAGERPAPGASATATPTPTPTPETLVGAGDIASCTSEADEATARLLDGIPGTVFTAGDNVYEDGAAREFAACYAPTWGRHLARTRPSTGNHDYNTPSAQGYFRYFGTAAGDPRTGYYSYELGSWHVVVLNSNCATVGGCQRGSPQERWLREDLAAANARCIAAYWHHPLFSSGPHGPYAPMRDLWSALDEFGAEIVISGHDHLYERFTPQDALGRAGADGIRQFVVGTGGRELYPVALRAANSEVVNAETFGVLRLTLEMDRYAWQFVPVPGSTFTDTGSARCR